MKWMMRSHPFKVYWVDFDLAFVGMEKYDPLLHIISITTDVLFNRKVAKKNTVILAIQSFKWLRSFLKCSNPGKLDHLKIRYKLGIVMLVFNPSTLNSEAGGSLLFQPAWSTEQAPAHPALHRKTLPQKATNKQKPHICIGIHNSRKVTVMKKQWNEFLLWLPQHEELY